MKDVNVNSYSPAYPCLFNEREEAGLTKREYYAGLAFHALLSNPERYKYIADLVSNGKLSQADASAKNAHKAVLLADALLEELEK
jgi:hypothetical protein